MANYERFGRYRLLRLLGEGGQGQVWHAVMDGPMGFQKEVALKMLQAGVSEDDRKVKSFVNEARLGGFLTHPNIVEIFEFNQVDDRFYLAMEFVNGPSLEELLIHVRGQGRTLSQRAALEAVIAAGSALQHAHTAKDPQGKHLRLIHRDVKPANMMIRADGVLKLMDFGIARSDANMFKTTDASSTKGTPVYMSPEQISSADQISARSDTWALGAVLYEVLTNNVLFRAPSVLGVLHKVIAGDLEQEIEEADQLLDGAGAILRRCLARQPEERYSEVAEFVRDLKVLQAKLVPGLLSLAEEVEPLAKEQAEALSLGTRAEGMQSANTLKSIVSGGKLHDSIDGNSFSDRNVQANLSWADGEPTPKQDDPNSVLAAGAGTNRGSVAVPTDLPAVTTRSDPDAGPQRTATKISVGLLLLVAMVLVTVVVVVFLITRPPGSNKQQSTVETIVEAGGETAVDGIIAPVPSSVPALDPGLVQQPDAGQKPDAQAVGSPNVEPVKPKSDPKTAPKSDPKTAPKSDPAVVVPTVKPDPPTSGGTGFLNVNSRPWSVVTIDGKEIGKTPVLNVELSAGNHSVVLRCTFCSPEQSQTINVSIPSGETVRKFHKFEE